MGWFSETKTYVGASVFNLNGNETTPPNLMGSAVVSSVIGRSPNLSSDIQSTLLGSTAMMQRRFFDWARTHYALGMPTGDIGGSLHVTSSKIHGAMRTALGLTENQTLKILTSQVDSPEVTYWAADWLRTNRPGTVDTAWTSELDLVSGQVHVDLVTSERVSFLIPDDLSWGLGSPGRYLLYVTYQIVAHNVVDRLGKPGPVKLFTYRMGSGNQAFDKFRKALVSMPEFFPPIPLRHANLSIRHASKPGLYGPAKEAFRKLYGRRNSIDDILDEMEANEDIGEIDFAYLVPGVALDTKNQAGLSYLYAFFKTLEAFQEADLIQSHVAERENSRAWDAAWSRWLNAHDPDNPRLNSPIYNTPAPTGSYDAAAAPGMNELRIRMFGSLNEFDISLRWLSIKETQHLGNCRHYDGDQTRAKIAKGKYWSHGTELDRSSAIAGDNYKESLKQVEIFHQYEKNRYRKIVVRGLYHDNHVYLGRSVKTSGYDAIMGAEQSPFIIPLHELTLRSLGLKQANQLSVSSSWLMFQHYKRVKLKWYQTKAFRWAVVIAAFALSVVTAGGSLAAAGGILGANAALGLSLGATAATAALVGAAVNAIAGMIVATLITKASVSLFGDKWGTVVGTIASFVALSYGTQYATQGNFAVDWGQMMRAENIHKITDSLGEAYGKWQMADTAQIYEQMGTLREEYSEKLEELSTLQSDILGMTGIGFDPMVLTDAAEHLNERRDTFLSRTLMTGSDIAELSLSMIGEFAQGSLELPQALR